MRWKRILAAICLAISVGIFISVGFLFFLDRLLFLHHNGALGAANVEELVERYKKAHRDKDIASLRAIHLEMRHGIAWWPSRSSRMTGVAEYEFPTLFDFDLVDVEVVHVAPRDGMIVFEYVRKRKPVKENGFSSIQLCSTAAGEGYKLLLIGRRPADPADSLMELDPDLGVGVQADGRLYLYAGHELEDVTHWIRTGHLPPVYHAPDHQSLGRKFDSLKEVPADWVRIVRPRK
jgi:hypothetical protein